MVSEMRCPNGCIGLLKQKRSDSAMVTDWICLKCEYILNVKDLIKIRC
jgi:hypothetical protein